MLLDARRCMRHFSLVAAVDAAAVVAVAGVVDIGAVDGRATADAVAVAAAELLAVVC